MTTHEVTFSGGKITFRKRTWTAHTRDSEMRAAPRMYVDVADETVLDNLMNRRSRPYNIYKTLIHKSDLSKVLDLSKLSWSQHAGCTCNCSPGFILNHQSITAGDSDWNCWDAWVTLGTDAASELKLL